jgi:hypothetical protein
MVLVQGLLSHLFKTRSLPEAQNKRVGQQDTAAPTSKDWVEDEDENENLKDCTQEMDSYKKLQPISHKGAGDSFNCIRSSYSTKHGT